ncbi:hypothetical protein, partial [Aquabacterium sp.]|uniref:hypothetical protein n=1 Tax=Aquabacterium sp. TaxID=1872578 RepID=UPI0025B9BCCC
PANGTTFGWYSPGNSADVDQAFVMPGGKTAIGRVALPIKPVNNGADLLVTLWPNNAGAPDTSGTPLSSTYVPASWINNLAAIDGLTIDTPVLAQPQFNSSLYLSSGTQSWIVPAGTDTSNVFDVSVVSSGNYSIILGGADDATFLAVNNVSVAAFNGGTTYGLPQHATPLPKNIVQGSTAATADTVMYAGGAAALTGTTTLGFKGVYTASWDPNTGTIGSWSKQPDLPAASVNGSGASYGNFVYVIGGDTDNTGATQTTAVYYNTSSNGSLSAWSTTTPLPTALDDTFAAALNGWLIVCGGAHTGVVASASVYYARINADGSLGAWNTGPNLPVPVYFAGGANGNVIDDYFIVAGGIDSGNNFVNDIQVISVTDAGLGNWVRTAGTGTSIIDSFYTSSFTTTNGSGVLVAVDRVNQRYVHFEFSPVPLISIPLPATGLTATGTYHVVMQQNQGPDASSYLSFGYQINTPLPNNMKTSTRNSGTWTNFSTATAVPMVVYDKTASGSVIHTWDDPNDSTQAAATTTLVLSSNQKTLLGLCESTTEPNNALDANPAFTSVTAPWYSVGCTLTRSSAQTHGGFPFSGLITPDGVTNGPYIESENIPISTNPSLINGEFYYVTDGWVYSSAGWNQVSISINWFDRNGVYISTSFSGTNIAAATWTHLVKTFEVPVGAHYAGVNPTMTNTPAVTDLLYLSNIRLLRAPVNTGALSAVSYITYADGVVPPRPIGVTKLN